jgi:hypothetical protein
VDAAFAEPIPEASMNLSKICKRSFVTCQRDASAGELARTMHEHHVDESI